MGVVLSCLIGLIALTILGKLEFSVSLAFLGAGVIVALIGFIDDHHHIPPQWRMLVHFIAALWALSWVGLMPTSNIIGGLMLPKALEFFIVIIFLVWLLNLYNFMDGIDGVAASEAIFIAGCGLLFSSIDTHTGLQVVAIVLIGSTVGFLFWNWPPAKIFMGDVGSGFLGITLGVYAWWAVVEEVVSLWSWIIIFGVFFVDATFTLLRRFSRGKPWYQAHCSHAYQHAAKKWGHMRVTVVICLINVTWLLPIAYFSNIHRDWGGIFASLALTPLVMIVLLLKAGLENEDAGINASK